MGIANHRQKVCVVLLVGGGQMCIVQLIERVLRALQECARVAALESQVRALCAELGKASAVRSSVKRVTLPALLGVESRLQQVAQEARRPVAAQ